MVASRPSGVAKPMSISFPTFSGPHRLDALKKIQFFQYKNILINYELF